MLEIINISNCYGIQGRNHIENLQFGFDDKKKNNAIFGINMCGKTSFVKVIKKLINNENIENVFLNDENPEVDIKIDGELFSFKNNKWDKKCEKQIFVCDKDFLHSSISIIQEKAVLGLNIEELEGIRKEKTESFINSDEIKKMMKEKFSLNKQGDCTGFLKSLSFTEFFGQKGKHFNLILDFYDKYEKGKETQLLNDAEYYGAIDLLKQGKVDFAVIENYFQNIKKITDTEIKKYEINTTIDKNFYKEVIRYIETKNPIDCPVCLRKFEEDNTAKIILEKIEKAIDEYNNDANKALLVIELEKLSKGNHDAQHELYMLIEDSLKGKRLEEFYIRWPILKNNLEQIYETFPLFVGRELKLKYGSRIEKYRICLEKEKQILEKMKSVEGSKLLQNFNELNNAFPHILSKEIQAELDPNENFLKIEMKNANNISIDIYQERISSEGEKSILSLLYFFAYVKTISDNNQPIILIFDDPVDSNDNYNKHSIIDFIMQNINVEKAEITSLFFTHSSDVMRSLKMNYNWLTKFYLMTNESEKMIFAIDDSNLSVFDGPFPFFKKNYKKKGNNIYLDMVSLLPLLRDVIDHARILKINNESENADTKKDDRENENYYKKLYNKLSANFLHYNPIENEENSTLTDLFNIYKQNLLEFPYVEQDFKADERNAKKTVRNYIKDRKKLKKPYPENLIETIKFKNILGLYIRNKIEEIIYKGTISKLKKAKHEKFKKGFIKEKTVSNKINFIRKSYFKEMSPDDQQELNTLFRSLNKYKIIGNDFYHQINSYITPMLETKTDYLIEISEELDEKCRRYDKDDIN